MKTSNRDLVGVITGHTDVYSHLYKNTGTHMHTHTDLGLWFGSCHDEKTTGYLAMWPLDIGGSRNHSNITYSTTALCRACGHVCMIM